MSLPPNEIDPREPSAADSAVGAGQDRHVILFDGVCDLCHSGAAWVRARDRAGAFEFLPFQSPEVVRRWPGLDPVVLARSMHVIAPDGRIRAGIDAAPWIFSRLPGWGWLAALLAWPLVRALARPAYAFVARHRRSLPRLTVHGRFD